MTETSQTADRPWTGRVRDAALWLRDSALGGFGFTLVLAVGLAGWAASFIGLHHFGVEHMGLTSGEAWLVPATFDGAPAGLSIVVMRASTHGRSAIVWRLLIIGFTVLSSLINYAHITDPTGRWVAAFMPPSAIVLFEGLMSEARAAAQRRLHRPRETVHLLRWFFDRKGTLDIYRRHILGLELPEALQEGAETTAAGTAETKAAGPTETTVPARIPAGDTSVDTRADTSRDTSDTGPRDTGDTKPPTPVSPRSRKPVTPETAKVTAIKDPTAETQQLLGLMWSRGSEKKVSLADAEAETGRPKPTAARRLRAARDHYRAGRRNVNDTAVDTADDTSETDAEPEPAAAGNRH